MAVCIVWTRCPLKPLWWLFPSFHILILILPLIYICFAMWHLLWSFMTPVFFPSSSFSRAQTVVHTESFGQTRWHQWQLIIHKEDHLPRTKTVGDLKFAWLNKTPHLYWRINQSKFICKSFCYGTFITSILQTRLYRYIPRFHTF